MLTIDNQYFDFYKHIIPPQYSTYEIEQFKKDLINSIHKEYTYLFRYLLINEIQTIFEQTTETEWNELLKLDKHIAYTRIYLKVTNNYTRKTHYIHPLMCKGFLNIPNEIFNYDFHESLCKKYLESYKLLFTFDQIEGIIHNTYYKSVLNILFLTLCIIKDYWDFIYGKRTIIFIMRNGSSNFNHYANSSIHNEYQKIKTSLMYNIYNKLQCNSNSKEYSSEVCLSYKDNAAGYEHLGMNISFKQKSIPEPYLVCFHPILTQMSLCKVDQCNFDILYPSLIDILYPSLIDTSLSGSQTMLNNPLTPSQMNSSSESNLNTQPPIIIHRKFKQKEYYYPFTYGQRIIQLYIVGNPIETTNQYVLTVGHSIITDYKSKSNSELENLISVAKKVAYNRATSSKNVALLSEIVDPQFFFRYVSLKVFAESLESKIVRGTLKIKEIEYFDNKNKTSITNGKFE